MKKILSLLGAIGLLSSAAISTVSCGELDTTTFEEKKSDRINGAPYDVDGNLILTPTEWEKLADISGPEIEKWIFIGGSENDYPSSFPDDAEITYGWGAYNSVILPEIHGNIAIGYITKIVRTNGCYYNFKSEFKRNINKDIYSQIKMPANW